MAAAAAAALVPLALLALLPLVRPNDNGLALAPPMGWMAWERFRCDTDCKDDPRNCISEALFRDMADRLSEDGWRELGFEYVIIDDCWMNRTRDSEGKLQPDANRYRTVRHGFNMSNVRSEQHVGIRGTALKWFQSYLMDRTVFLQLGQFPLAVSG